MQSTQPQLSQLSQISQISLVVGIVAAFVPTLAAVRARMLSWRDPVGQVALCWTVMALTGVAAYTRYYLGFPPRWFSVPGFVFATFPLLLVPATLTWIGPRAARWRWPALALWCAICAVTIATLGGGRILMTVAYPVMGAAMSVLSGWALATRVHAEPEAMRRQSWFWILTAHIVYFMSDIFRGPVSEALVARHWNAVTYVNDGVLLIYAAVYVVIARGILLAGDRAARRGVPEPVARTAA